MYHSGFCAYSQEHQGPEDLLASMGSQLSKCKIRKLVKKMRETQQSCAWVAICALKPYKQMKSMSGVFQDINCLRFRFDTVSVPCSLAAVVLSAIHRKTW